MARGFSPGRASPWPVKHETRRPEGPLPVRCLTVDASTAELDVVLLPRVQAATHMMAGRRRRSEQVPRGDTVVVCGRRRRTEHDVDAAVVGVVLLQAQRERHASTEAPAGMVAAAAPAVRVEVEVVHDAEVLERPCCGART